MTDDSQKTRAAEWFENLQSRICAAFEAIEDEFAEARASDGPAGRFERRAWQRAHDSWFLLV